MRQTVSRALVILACVVAASCGGSSDPTSPSSPAATGSGGSGGTGGGGTGGSETFRASTPVTDSFFDDNDWDDIVETYSASGSGSAGHLTFNGQAGAGYRQISINVTSASGSNAMLAVFAINRRAAYFPSSDGAILWIDYTESSINQSSGTVQYSAPAIRQNGKLYTLIPGGKAFTTPETSWTDHSLAHLTQSDFRTLASATDHPDFSRTGGRTEFGFMRLQAGQGQSKAGIDNFLMVLFRD
jgi:ABC-type glycerol-3-phosphate transport system substrate-binding protein